MVNIVRIQTDLQDSQASRNVLLHRDRLGWGGDSDKQCSSLVVIDVPAEEVATLFGGGTGCLVALARQLEVPQFENLTIWRTRIGKVSN